MKTLTHKKLNEAPGIVQFIYVASLYKKPIGSKVLDTAIERHPEYFKEEIEHRRKYDSIPSKVHDAFYEELKAAREKIFEGTPESKGALYYALNPLDYIVYKEAAEPLNELYNEAEKVLRAKYYDEYLK